MPISVTHTTVAVGTDAGNGGIRKAQWNEAHTLSGTVDIANGGTGAATAAQALTNLAAAGITISNTFTDSRNTFGDGTADTRITINGATGTSRGVRFQTAGSPRWHAGMDTTAESGSNVGSDFAIARYDDTGTYVDTPFEIKRDTGLLDVTIRSGNKVGNGTGSTYYTLNGGAGSERGLMYETNGSDRWSIITSNDSESGSNAGSNFAVYRYDDAGSYLGTAISIKRDTGLVAASFDPNSEFGSNTTTNAFVNINAATSGQKMFQLRTAGSNRWLVGASNAAESGSNAGSNFEIYNYDDTGNYIEIPLKITRSNGATTLKTLVVDNTIDLANSDTTLSRITSSVLGVEGRSLPIVLAQSGAAQTIGATTAETVLATISVPAGIMGPNGTLYIFTQWATNNNANNKHCYIRVGGAAGTAMMQFTNSTHVGAARLTIIQNANSASSQKTIMPPANATGFGQYTSSGVTASVNTASAWDLVISGNKANSADTLTLESYSVMVLYGA